MRRLLVLCAMAQLACGTEARIAWVGPAQTPAGQEAIRGVRVWLEEARAPVELDVFDDGDDESRAASAAERIAASDAIAVIGHHCEACSAAAAPIYERAGIPAITAVSTARSLTRDNDWYFRSIIEDGFQARSIARYISARTATTSVSVLCKDPEIAGEFARAWHGEVVRLTSADEAPSDRPLVLLTNAADTAAAVLALKKRGFGAPIVGTHAMVDPQFLTAVGDVNLLNGSYVALPYSFEVADDTASKFRRAFIEKHSDAIPEWIAASTADAAGTLVQEIRHLPSGSLDERRQALRDRLAALNGFDRSFVGVTGFNYFDEHGDPRKPVTMAVMRHGRTEPALLVLLPDEKGEHFSSFDAVLTGVNPIRFSEIDFEAGTFLADFYVWFRHRPEIDLSSVLIANSVDEVRLDDPLEVRDEGHFQYRLYRVKAKLRTDAFAGSYGEHILGVSFRHATLTRDRMFFIGDSLAMGVQTAKSFADLLRQLMRLVDPSSGWVVRRPLFFEEPALEHSLGSPDMLNRSTKTREFSRFNIGVVVGPAGIPIRRILPLDVSKALFVFSAILLLLLVFFGKRRQRSRFTLQAIASCTALISAEVYVGELLLQATGPLFLPMARTAFDVLWWIVPAILIGLAVKRFVWGPLEAQAQRPVPTILKMFVAFTIYLLAAFGIVAFVLDQQLTSLLATSGVAAMIIGLAIQINITNIFSGIALNLERPFKVGDWIMVHGRTPDPAAGVIGCVVDINWRTTRLKTTSRSIVVIPNGQISEKTITNFMVPTEVSRFELIFNVDQSVPSDRVMSTIKAGVTAVVGKGPLAEPPFKVRINLSTSNGIEYSVRYFIVPRDTSPAKARHILTESVLAHLQDAGISLAQNPQDVRYAKVDPPFADDS